MSDRSSCVIAVIIPCYNDDVFLEEALDSLYRQTLQEWECVVVDDASTNQETRKCLDAINDPRITVVRHECNKGQAAARNTGIRLTSAPLIFLLDSDDQLMPNALELTVKAFGERPDVDLFYPDYDRFGAVNDVFVPPAMDFYHLIKCYFVLCSSPFRRSAWEKISGFCEDDVLRIGMEDVDFHFSLLESGATFAHLPNVIYRYRSTPESSSDRMQIHNYRIRRFIADRHQKLLKGSFRQDFLLMGAIRSYRSLIESSGKRVVMGSAMNIVRHCLWPPRMWWTAAWNIVNPLLHR